MPNITVELLSGRSLDQRREFAEAVTAAAVDILKRAGPRCASASTR